MHGWCTGFTFTSAGNSEESKAMTSHPVLTVDEAVVKGVSKEGGEVPASRKEDGGSRDSKLPSAVPVTSKCWSVRCTTSEDNLDD